MNEADTCRKYVVPKLQTAGWENDPHSLTEQKSFTDGRIVVVGNKARRQAQKRADYLLRYTRDFPIAVNVLGKSPRYYQEIAINRAVQSVVQGQHRVLLTMATGTGKTFVAFQICWKLWSARWNRTGDHRKPRILFLADRNILVDDPYSKMFAPFGDARAKLEGGNAVKSREMYFSIYQALAGAEGRPSLFYDFAGVYSFGRGVFRSQSRTGAEFSYRIVTQLQHGELVYLKVGAWEGAFGVVPPECDGCVVSPEFPVFVIDSELLLPRFLELLLGVPAVWKSLSGGSTGTNARRRRLHPNDLLKCSVLAPSLEEQRAIVAHVDAVQGAAREAQKIRTNVESEFDALLMSAYQSISEGAPRMPLGEVAPVVRREVSIDPEATYTELGVRSFYKGTFQRRTIVGAEFSWQDLYRVKKGDLVFSNIMAWEKAIAVAKPEDDDCVGNHRMLTCEARSDCAVPSFLWYYFTTHDGFEKVHAASPGTAARNRTLTAKALQAIPVPVPTVDRQRWFDSVFAEVDHARRLQKAAAEEQRQLIPSLVQRLFAPGIDGATASYR